MKGEWVVGGNGGEEKFHVGGDECGGDNVDHVLVDFEGKVCSMRMGGGW